MPDFEPIIADLMSDLADDGYTTPSDAPAKDIHLAELAGRWIVAAAKNKATYTTGTYDGNIRQFRVAGRGAEALRLIVGHKFDPAKASLPDRLKILKLILLGAANYHETFGRLFDQYLEEFNITEPGGLQPTVDTLQARLIIQAVTDQLDELMKMNGG